MLLGEDLEKTVIVEDESGKKEQQQAFIIYVPHDYRPESEGVKR